MRGVEGPAAHTPVGGGGGVLSFGCMVVSTPEGSQHLPIGTSLLFVMA